MRQANDALRDTLVRIHALLAETGTPADDVLDVAELARSTALPAADVRALLDGQQLPDDDVETRVRQRVRALYEARIAETGRRPSDVRQEVQDHLQISREWARHLCSGTKVPNVRMLRGLRDFFGVPHEFLFTATATEALNCALQPILRRLEATSGDLLARYLEDFDQMVIAHRGTPLTRQEIKVMQSFSTAMLEGTGRA